MRRLSARYWRFLVHVHRSQGVGAAGESWSAATAHLAMVFREARTVRDQDGSEVVSTVTVHLPAGVDEVPVGSLVDLPAGLGGGTTRVIAWRPRFFDGSTRLAYHTLDCE